MYGLMKVVRQRTSLKLRTSARLFSLVIFPTYMWELFTCNAKTLLSELLQTFYNQKFDIIANLIVSYKSAAIK